MLDTGASHHVLTRDFYHRAFPGRPLDVASQLAISWAGSPQAVHLARSLPVTWPDAVSESLDFAVAAVLPSEGEAGLVGILSPQRLGSTMEMDFPGGELKWLSGPRDTELEGAVVYSAEDGTLTSCGQVTGWSTTISGARVWALVDTGAILSGLSLQHPLAQLLLPAGGPGPLAMSDASRTPVLSVRAPAWAEVGGRRWFGHIALMQMDHPPCGFQAVLGMDLLSRCRLTLSGREAVVRCAGR